MKSFITAILASAILATSAFAQPAWTSKGEFFEEDGYTYTVEVSDWRKSKWRARREAAETNAKKLPGTVQVRDVFFEVREDGLERATVLSFTEYDYKENTEELTTVYVPASVRQQSKAVEEKLSNELAELNAQNARVQARMDMDYTEPSPAAIKLARTMQRELDRRIEAGEEVGAPTPKEDPVQKYKNAVAYGSVLGLMLLVLP